MGLIRPLTSLGSRNLAFVSECRAAILLSFYLFTPSFKAVEVNREFVVALSNFDAMCDFQNNFMRTCMRTLVVKSWIQVLFDQPVIILI